PENGGRNEAGIEAKVVGHMSDVAEVEKSQLPAQSRIGRRGAPATNLTTPGKIVSSTKVAEWRGLDRINAVVHGMKCIWREQEKDDIGVDGEIELCRSRDDGEGLVGTGKIVKVQSKSGSSYVIKDEEKRFSSPVKEKDLHYWNGLNVPIIYVVYHPDDNTLYWK